MSRMRSTKGGCGITTSNGSPSIAATWISSPCRINPRTGEIAAFCTTWYDDVTRTAYFEPVGTAPEHQRRGLDKAVLTEALRRMQQMGCVLAFVGGYSVPANALYASAGFTEYALSEPWTREW